jgi:Zn-dependent M28 family amino/carboxypeptidase
MKFKLILFSLVLSSAFLYSQKLDKNIQNAMEKITEVDLRSHTVFLSDDLLEGRKTGTRGGEVAAKYISEQFRSLGLKPPCRNGSSYFQNIELIGTKMDQNMTLVAQGGGNFVKFDYYTEFIGFTGDKDSNISIKEADLVFAGYGITAPEYDWDDFKDFDVKGKVLLIMNNDPSKDPSIFEGSARTYYGRWDYKYRHAAEKGALGAIIIHTTESAAYGWQVVQNSWSNEKFDLKNDIEPGIKLTGWLSESATKRILKLGGWFMEDLLKSAENKNFKPVSLDIKVSLDMNCKIRPVGTKNVIGLLEGSDTKLKDEYVVYTAHYDHLGIGTPVNGDSIYNGAFDNATGVSALLAIAKSFASMENKPKRSILFIATASEEEGLLGARYFIQNPLYPLNKISVEINMDAVNVWGVAKNVALIGCKYSNLFDYVKNIANSIGMNVIDDPNPNAGSFYRSDQLCFANAGIPTVYFSNGDDFEGKPADWGKNQIEKFVAEDYHQPSDEVKKWWVFAGMKKNTELYFLTGYKLANDLKKPEWKKGTRFYESWKKLKIEK